jgi:curved DNA-binding protein CbpA
VAETTVANLRLVEILLELHDRGRGAIIRLVRGKEKKQLVLRRGMLAFAESSVPEEHLARILLKMKLLEHKHLSQITQHMKMGKSSEEAIVLAAGLDGHALEDGANEQATCILATLLSWKGSEAKLYAGEDSVQRHTNLQLPIPTALVLATRRAVSEHLIRPPADLLDRNIAVDPSARGMSLPLDQLEAHAYSQVQCPTPTGTLLPLLTHDGTDPQEVLLRLLTLGLFRIEVPASSAPSASSRGVQTAIFAEEIEELLSKNEVADLYEILALPSDAEEDAIKAAYHELAKRFHPDRFESKEHSPEFRENVERLFTFITGAYSTLIDPATRAVYDDARRKDGQVERAIQAKASTDLEEDKMAETLFRAGTGAISEGDYETAARHLKECVWLRPKDANFQLYLGIAQAEISKFRKEAEQHLLEAIKIDRTKAQPYLELGKLYLKVNLPKRAAAQFEEVLRWDPQNHTARSFLDELAQGGEQPRTLAERMKARRSG